MNKTQAFIFFIGLICLSVACNSKSAGSSASEISGATTATAPPATNATRLTPATPVEIFEVKSSAVSNELIIPAVTSVEETVTVLAGRDGTIIDFKAQEGVRVAKGMPLVRFDDAAQLEQIRQAELDVSRLKIEEAQFDALIKVNRSEFDRETQLAKSGATSQRDVERAEYRLLASTNEYEKTRIATQTAQARLKSARIEMEKNTVNAPVDGIITRRFVTLGTGVARNERLFEIASSARLQIRFQLPQTERQLSTNSIIAISSVDGNQASAQARIRRAEPATLGTLEYLADVIGGRLAPGTAVNVRVPRPAVASTMWVPRVAFRTESDLRAGAIVPVMVVEDGRCAERLVGVSALNGDHVEIVSGLMVGEKVILAPPPTMRAGDAVEVRGL